ncbi:trans-1,2-dihydrobenzene-1,2-diol dehydrogenase-like [Oratosquilla oratoria]|uniref:trans-1,2-dihydrobenzene-1,2-diol dehydrogenase-like n=1 Tax=Oratosquilla oratoria TaxID=337810 RepID=UPI003F76D17C
MATKWGIAGAGKISTDFVSAMKSHPAGEHRVVAIAARDLKKAQDFASKHGAEKAYGSYQDLAKDPEIDVVYVGVINPYHLSVAKDMIEGGKPVLVEKPLCMNYKETKQLVDLAKKKKVFLMEAIWSRCFPVYEELIKRIQSGEIGDVVQVFSSLGAPIEGIDNVSKKELGGGAILAAGIYPVQFASLVMGSEKPLAIYTGGHLNKNGVDETSSTTLVYSKGRVATLNCSIRCELPNVGIVVGTKGTIEVPCPMWAPTSLTSPSGTFSSPFPKTDQEFNLPNSQGLMYESAEVRRCLQQGLLESLKLPHDETLLIAETLESMRKQMGVHYEQDED